MIKFRKQRFVKLKFAVSIILAIFLGFQIWFLVVLIKYNTTDFRSVSIDDFITLSDGEKVKFTVAKSQVIISFENSYKPGRVKDVTLSEDPIVETRNIVVADKDDNVFMLYVKKSDNSGNYDDLGRLMDGDVDSLSFKGKVTGLQGVTREELQSKLKEEKTGYGYVPDKISGTAIEFNNLSESQDRFHLVSSIISVVILLALIVLLLRKSINNFIYGYLVDRGKIKPELKIKKEDLIIQNDASYAGSDNDSDSFYSVAEGDDSAAADPENDDPEKTYHFTKRMRENELDDTHYERTEPTFSDGSPLEMYTGGVNEDGNFYINEENTQSVDSDGNEIKKY